MITPLTIAEIGCQDDPSTTTAREILVTSRSKKAAPKEKKYQFSRFHLVVKSATPRSFANKNKIATAKKAIMANNGGTVLFSK